MKITIVLDHREILEGIRMAMAAKGIPLVAIEKFKFQVRQGTGYAWIDGSDGDHSQVEVVFDAEAYSSVDPMVACPTCSSVAPKVTE